MSSNLIVLIVFDAILAIAALFTAAAARFGFEELNQKLFDSSTITTLITFIAVVIFSSHLMEVYDQGKNVKRREILVNILFGTITSFSLISVVFYLIPGVELGRGVLFISLCFNAFFQFSWHSFYLVGKKRHRFSQRVLVLGTGTLAAQISEMLSSNNQDFVFAGYAECRIGSHDGNTDFMFPEVSSDLIIGNSDDLLGAAQRAKAEVIVVALSERRGVFPLREVLKCRYNGIQIMDATTLYELAQGKLMLESITPSGFIFASGFRSGTIFSFCKRATDIILSCSGLLLTLPFFPLIALAIKLDSSGPVFFRQERVGYKEKRFVLCKFRTMGQDAEKGTGAVWAEKNDPRVTRLGRFFRKSRIDEIPQLFNVLKGEMSFIGPRPERPEFVEKLNLIIPYYSNRHFIKPGLTGWAQVRYSYGSSIEDTVEKLRYDLYYIKNVSPFLDTLIILETIKVVLFGFGGR